MKLNAKLSDALSCLWSELDYLREKIMKDGVIDSVFLDTSDAKLHLNAKDGYYYVEGIECFGRRDTEISLKHLLGFRVIGTFETLKDEEENWFNQIMQQDGE